MSALPSERQSWPSSPEVRHVASLRDGLPYWPGLSRFSEFDLVPAAVLGTPPPSRRPVTQGEIFVSHLAFAGPEGLEQLTRAIREGIRRAKAGAR